jgi:ribosome-binding protein aMBF1 (putative translation factor)
MSEDWTSGTLPQDLAFTIAAARRARGWSCRQAAAEVGISPAHMSRLERGIRCPSVAVAEDLIRVLQLDPEDASRLLTVARPDAGRSHPLRHRLVR